MFIDATPYRLSTTLSTFFVPNTHDKIVKQGFKYRQTNTPYASHITYRIFRYSIHDTPYNSEPMLRVDTPYIANFQTIHDQPYRLKYHKPCFGSLKSSKEIDPNNTIYIWGIYRFVP